MAVAFNPSEEVREGQQQQHQHHHHQSQQQQMPNSANNQPQPVESPADSATSSSSSSASSSTTSSPGAVTAPMSIPPAQYAVHHQPNAPVYYYPTGSSPQVPPQSPVPPTATVYRQYNNEELIQAICEALHRCSNGSCAHFTFYYMLLVLVAFFD